MHRIKQIIQHREQGVLTHKKLPRYAVLIPLVEMEGEMHVLFQERALHLKRQPGEICFPGGRIEQSDRNEQAAAIRETCEELGLTPEDVTCFGPLDYLVEPHRLIYPFVGQIKRPDRMKPSADEVSRLFYAPLNELKTFVPEIHYVDMLIRPREGFPYDAMPDDRGPMWKRGEHAVYFYKFDSFTVWGLTAVILHHFLELIRDH